MGMPMGFPALLLVAVSAAGAQDVTLVDHPDRGELVLTIGPVDLPAEQGGHGGHGHVGDPALGDHMHGGGSEAGVTLAPRVVSVPRTLALHAVALELVDRTGDAAPRNLLHHVNVIRPGHRELFLPVSQRLFAAGQETADHRVPRFLLGLPVDEGEVWEVLAMFHNPTSRSFEGVELRIRLSYMSAGRVFPLGHLHPFHLDVAFPAGDKSFDLPPGLHEWSYEGTPATNGRILALSGHVHEGARWIRLEDATSGRVLWEGRPVTGENGEVLAMPVGSFLFRGGVRVRADRRYRVTVAYENGTGRTIPRGGMGVIGGIMVTTRGSGWPEADPTHPLFRLDQAFYREEISGSWESLVASGRIARDAGGGRGGAWLLGRAGAGGPEPR
jgi:hypothetical protein